MSEKTTALDLTKTVDIEFLAANFDEKQETGMENLRREDFAKPKLLLCQAQTPHRKKSSDVYIEELDEGDFFNIVTRENYGPEIEVIPVYVGSPYGMAYDDSGKVTDFNVPLDDPRMIGHTDSAGKYHSAEAKVHLDYTLLIVKQGDEELEAVIWTAKGAGRQTAKSINVACESPLKITKGDKITVYRRPPMYARAFGFRSGEGSNDNKVIVLGIPRIVTKREFQAAAALHEAILEQRDQEADRF